MVLFSTLASSARNSLERWIIFNDSYIFNKLVASFFSPNFTAELNQVGVLAWLPVTICTASVAFWFSKKPLEPSAYLLLFTGTKKLSSYEPERERLVLLVNLVSDITSQVSAAAGVVIKPEPTAVTATASVKAALPITDETVDLQEDLPCACVFSATTINAPRCWLKITRYCLFIVGFSKKFDLNEKRQWKPYQPLTAKIYSDKLCCWYTKAFNIIDKFCWLSHAPPRQENVRLLNTIWQKNHIIHNE